MFLHMKTLPCYNTKDQWFNTTPHYYGRFFSSRKTPRQIYFLISYKDTVILLPQPKFYGPSLTVVTGFQQKNYRLLSFLF
jgi:hypothetical protein